MIREKLNWLIINNHLLASDLLLLIADSTAAFVFILEQN